MAPFLVLRAQEYTVVLLKYAGANAALFPIQSQFKELTLGCSAERNWEKPSLESRVANIAIRFYLVSLVIGIACLYLLQKLDDVKYAPSFVACFIVYALVGLVRAAIPSRHSRYCIRGIVAWSQAADYHNLN